MYTHIIYNQQTTMQQKRISIYKAVILLRYYGFWIGTNKHETVKSMVSVNRCRELINSNHQLQYIELQIKVQAVHTIQNSPFCPTNNIAPIKPQLSRCVKASIIYLVVVALCEKFYCAIFSDKQKKLYLITVTYTPCRIN